MLKFFSKRINNKKGFTLIELIVVIAILAILALIAIPRVGKFRTNAAISSHNANVRTLESAASMYLAEKGLPGASNTIKWNGTEESSFSDEWKNYIAEWPTIPSGLRGTEHDGLGASEKVNFGDTTIYTVTIENNAGKAVVTVEPKLIKTASP